MVVTIHIKENKPHNINEIAVQNVMAPVYTLCLLIGIADTIHMYINADIAIKVEKK